jgi:hypothetical protein
VNELVAVDNQCTEALPRLKNLVERVILTEQNWGYPTTGVQELVPPQAFVGPSGEQVFFKP